MRILVTGGAGFIGFYVAKALLERGDEVIIVDNFSDYYDVSLKEDRIAQLKDSAGFSLVRADIADSEAMSSVFQSQKIDKICHLAAQAGVRYSLQNPEMYIRSNIQGTCVLLELSRKFGIKDFVFASSSSVYGGNIKIPFSESDPVETPISVYAATKRSAELLAYTYHKLYGINCTGLRFFTVYGRYGRPDMAYFKFVKNIMEGKPIEVYNDGECRRDFTHVSDIVKGVIAAIDSSFGYELINLGNNTPVEVNRMIEIIERETGEKAVKKMLPLQQGDVLITYADIDKAKKLLSYIPLVKIEQGIKDFVEWYKTYYGDAKHMIGHS